MNKRVLIVGYYYVDANMGGVRLRRIVRRLPGEGWEVVVLTHPPMAGASADPGPIEGVRVEEIDAPDLTRVYERLRRFGRRPASHVVQTARAEPAAKSIGFTSEINRWLMVPDKQIPWYRPALRRARELMRREKFDAIFATLDPRTSLLLAARLSRESAVPCVLEYRDLWIGNPYYHITQPTALHRWLHERLERGALRRATRVSAVCRGIADLLSSKYASVLRAPVELHYNFFDPGEYPPVEPAPRGAGPFTICYAGALYGNRTPHVFFEGMRQFIDRLGLTPAQFQFRWAGSASGIADLSQALDRAGVRPYLDFRGQIPHRESLGLMRQSDVALVIQSPDDTIHVPGKLFEAMGARVPVLALSSPCETADIVTACRAGIVSAHAPAAVVSALVDLHKTTRAGTPWAFDEAALRRFEALTAVGRLAALFDEISS